MQKLIQTLSRLSLRLFFKPVIGSSLPLGFQRRWFDLMTKSLGRPRGIERSDIWVGSIAMSRLRKPSDGEVGPTDPTEREAILFAHGGGFVIGGGDTYAGFASWLAEVTGADVYLPDYRLAPEDPQPAPTDDLFAAYRAIIDLGYSPKRIAVLGDSAGGALAVAMVRSLREMGVPSPAALVLISPWLDLSLSGNSVTAIGRRDPVLRREWLDRSARQHAAGLRVDDPRVSPLFADLRTLPPTLVQAGTDDILFSDSTRFADRAYAAGIDLELQRFEGLWHVFQGFAMVLEPARTALDDVAAFLRRRFDAAGV